MWLYEVFSGVVIEDNMTFTIDFSQKRTVHCDCHHSKRLTQCSFKRCIAPMFLRDHFFKSVLKKEGERDVSVTAKYTF